MNAVKAYVLAIMCAQAWLSGFLLFDVPLTGWYILVTLLFVGMTILIRVVPSLAKRLRDVNTLIDCISADRWHWLLLEDI